VVAAPGAQRGFTLAGRAGERGAPQHTAPALGVALAQLAFLGVEVVAGVHRHGVRHAVFEPHDQA
jgi:hypothetical protein